MSTVTEMRVHMCCAGCEEKIKKTLDKIKGVDEVEIDMGMQKVTVNGYAEEKKVLKAVRRTGRRAELWKFPYQPEVRSFTHQYPNQSQGNNAQAGGATYFSQAQPSSSYNYYKHGYDGHEYHGYHNSHNANSLSSLGAGRTGDAFSDENPNACSIM